MLPGIQSLLFVSGGVLDEHGCQTPELMGIRIKVKG
jgi:hypothetical protein